MNDDGSTNGSVAFNTSSGNNNIEIFGLDTYGLMSSNLNNTTNNISKKN